MPDWILSLLVFLPLAGALAVAFCPRRIQLHPWIALVVTLSTFLISAWLFVDFPEGSTDFHYVQKLAWIPSLGIEYHLGLDGTSLVLCALTAFLGVVTMFFMLGHETYASKEFLVAFLTLQSAIYGTFASLDIFLFYIFWEAMLVPMYYMIGRFGGEARRYASLKFFIYTMAGSVFMLIGIIWLYLMGTSQFGVDARTTSILALYKLQIPSEQQLVLFALFTIAFLIKIPLFPFHTWLPDAHVEAPTPGSVILAGVLLKMGGYGLLRFALPLFPNAAIFLSPWIASLGVVGIIYGAYVAWFQKDMKKLVAYSSVSHMGFVVLGIFSLKTTAMSGAMFQMVAHGLSTGALFLLIGILYERTHTRMIEDYGGLATVMPKFTALFLVVTMASIGLPGLSGFVGEFLILSGSFDAGRLLEPSLITGVAVLGVVLGAAYMLSLYERVFLGPVLLEKNKTLPDIHFKEIMTVFIPIMMMLWLGLMPNVILAKIEAPLEKLQQLLR